MKDRFTEDVIKKEKNTENTVLVVVLAVMAGIVFLLNVLGIFLLGYITSLVLGFLAYYVSMKRNVEYEFVMTNESVEVDAVYNRESRKSLIAFELTQVQLVAPTASPRLEHERNTVRKSYRFVTGVDGHPRYSLLCEVKGVKSEVVIEPTERIVEHIRYFCPNVFYED